MRVAFVILLLQQLPCANGDVLRKAETMQQQLILRSASDLEHPITINKNSIEAKTIDQQSMIPDGLMSGLRDHGQFFDLAAYVIEVARGGLKRTRELKPTAEQLAIQEDWIDLDQAGILKKT